MTFLLVLLVKSSKCWKRREQKKTLICSPNSNSKSSEAMPDLSIYDYRVYTASSVNLDCIKPSPLRQMNPQSISVSLSDSGLNIVITLFATSFCKLEVLFSSLILNNGHWLCWSKLSILFWYVKVCVCSFGHWTTVKVHVWMVIVVISLAFSESLIPQR